MNRPLRVVGMDLGDRVHRYCVLDEEGEVVERGKLACTEVALRAFLVKCPGSLVAMEAGTHSAWVARVVGQCGHRALVGNARQLPMIYQSKVKDDERDAERLARLARLDPKLLAPITHRGEQAQADLALLKARDQLVATRSKLINHVRGTVKAHGGRLRTCSADSFHRKTSSMIPAGLREAVQPVMEMIEALTQQTRNYERRIEQISHERYPETELLKAVPGVGPLTALGFVLILDDPHRFVHSRDVGAYLGLTPRRDQSGASDLQLGITKAGSPYLRRLLVGCAHYILGPFGPDSALRRWGLHLCESGGKRAKKRAVVAVARKLAVLLHQLWVRGEVYCPFPEARARHHSTSGGSEPMGVRPAPMVLKELN